MTNLAKQIQEELENKGYALAVAKATADTKALLRETKGIVLKAQFNLLVVKDEAEANVDYANADLAMASVTDIRAKLQLADQVTAATERGAKAIEVAEKAVKAAEARLAAVQKEVDFLFADAGVTTTSTTTEA